MDPLPEKSLENLLSMLDYDKKLAAMTPRELIFEALGSRAADYRVVVALMDRVLPDWQEQFTDEELESKHVSTERFAPLPAPPADGEGPERAAEEYLGLCRDTTLTKERDRLAAIIRKHCTPAAPVDGPKKTQAEIEDALISRFIEDDEFEEMANAFLKWPLPESVCADRCATEQGKGRIGTNLLSYTEALSMFVEVCGPVLASRSSVRTKPLDGPTDGESKPC